MKPPLLANFKQNVRDLALHCTVGQRVIEGFGKTDIFRYRNVASSRPVYYSIFYFFWSAAKGQLISKGLCGGIVSTKKPTKFF